MAEFKLGRIRFVWKDVWTTATTYYIDDVVRNGGKTYICQAGHVAAADFYTDLDYSPTRWELMSDGQEWKGDWAPDTFYKDGDIVKYGGTVYTCNDSHTSAATVELGLEANISDWDVFAESFDWKEDWTVDTQYKVNDLVKFGGRTFVCNTAHVSAATTTLGLEADESKWDIFNDGLEFKGNWNGSSVVYKVNDVVKQGASLWICTDHHTSTASFTTDSALYWSQFVEGIEFENTWNISTTYQRGDVVRYGGNQYVAKTNHIGETPSTSTANWDLFQEGISFSSDWSSVTSYRVGNLVRLRGYTYLATADSLNQEPPNLTYWQRLNSGISWQNEWTDDVEYKLGDAVRYGSNAYICVLGHRSEGDDGSTVGPEGGGAANSRPDQDVTGTYWNLLSIGTETSVLSARGDLVYYGGSGPTRLPIGREGQVLRAGAEDPEWVTLGEIDQVYFVAPHGVDAPAPIQGKTFDKPFKTIRYACEQVEKGPRNPNAQRLLELNRVFIQREVTSWIDYQIANATVGSIWEDFDYDEYKCERDTGFLVDRLIWDIGHGGNLKMRAAAQSYINALGDGPFSKEEEDMPYNRLTEEAANDIAAFNYMVDLVEDVLNNRAPSVVYQDIADDSTKIAEQYIDLSLVAETGVMTDITSLVTIVTDALANPTQVGTLPTIPDRYVPNTLIRVATGRYRETLPIIVPAYTCVQGDELRSTNAGPAGSLVDISDSFYTIDTFSHLESFIGNIVTGTSVTPTIGNTVSQFTDWPVADAAEATAVVDLVGVMKHQSDYRLNTMHVATLTDPVGYNVSYLAGYGNARTLIKENKRFLQEEIVAYINNTYSQLEVVGSISGTILTVSTVDLGTVTVDTVIRGESVIVGTAIARQLTGTTGGVGTYEVTISQTVPSTTIKGDTHFSRTKTRRDAGYIIDAVVYDLTYGGNAQSVTAGLAYYDGDNADSTIAVAQIPASIKAATLGTVEFLKTRMQQVATAASFTPLQTNIARVTGTAGSAGASTAIGNNVDDIIEIIDTGPGAVGSTVTLVDPTPADGVNSTTALISAYSTLNSAASTIRSNTISYINSTYPSLVYDETKCSRDVGIILKAVGFDFMFNSNYQTLKAAHSYLRLNASDVYTLGQKTVTIAAIEYARTQAIANVGANATAIARINTLMTLIKDIIYGATDEGQVCSTELRNRDYAILQLERNRDFIVAEVQAWVNYNYVNFNNYYNSATCERDVGMIIDAVSYDLITGSNFASSVAGTSYYRIQAELVVNSQSKQTLAIIKYLRTLAADYVDSTDYADVWNSFTNIYNILENGLTAAPTYTFPNNGSTVADDSTSAGTFQANRATYQSDIASYLNTNYNALWVSLGAEGQAACTRDVGYIVDAVTYDTLYGGNYQSVIAGDAYYSFGTLQIAPGEVTATLAAYGELKSLLSGDAEAASQAGVEGRFNDIIAIITNGAGTEATTYPDETGETVTIQGSFTDLQAAKATLATAVTTYITDTFSSYEYAEALCLRDVGTYIDALKWDLKYTANYKSRYVARYYANAVLGSFEEDMYYLRDGTGIRDQSLEGLNGDLLPPNQYGTSRVSAGAYASLDPGWGPDDFRTWINSRSPYVQGVTTFGNAAIGQKIDGALHNGGNDSMVSNDFTQVISDGIGAWVANNGRAELVSVFTYYAHVGYLSTEGGRIRGTNGNNSYGDFGSVAEGFDDTEVPNTGVVDNKFQFIATVGSVTTTGQQFIGLEFDNAGVEYTEAEFTLTGGGINAVAEADEFRDDAVYQVRLLQLAADGLDGEFGGQGYVTNSNTAQGGGATSITLAATDAETSTAYIGMKVVITGGAGVGQFAIIDTYNSGTKLAGVVKESTGVAGWDHFVAGTTIVSPDASSTYTVEPRVTFSAPSYASAEGTGLPTAGAYSAIAYAPLVATYLAVASTGGDGSSATFNVIKKGTKYIVTVASGGTGYTRLDVLTITGTDVGGASTTNDITLTVTSVNSVTGAVTAVDFVGQGQGGNYVALLAGDDIAVTSTGGSWSSRALPSIETWSSLAVGQNLTSIAANELVAGVAYKITSLGDSLFNAVGAENNFVGQTFIATGPTSGTGTVIAVNSVVVAIASGTNETARSVDGGVTWTAGGDLPSTTTWTSVAYGQGVWVAVATGGTANAYSTDGGQTWTAGGALPASTTWTSVAYGAGKFVAVASGGTQAASSADLGLTWTSRTLPSSTNWSSVAFGNNRFVAVSSTSGTDAAYSLDGITWLASTITSTAYTSIAYGQGTFLAVGASTTAATSPDGVVWTSRTISTSDSSAVAFGNVNSTGKFVTISDTGATNVSIISAGTTARARASVANGKIFAVRILEPGSGYSSTPTLTFTDPNNIFEAPFTVRIGDGVLANPSFVNRGTQYETASAEILRGNGYADNFQPGSFVACRRLESRPVPGSNIVFSNLPDRTFKLVNVITFRGQLDGSYTGFLQISPQLTISEAPEHLVDATLRLRYSQVRLTGHDFLDIGTGSFLESNYPGTPFQEPIPANETVDNNGGRVFFTATDQDGNFRVGDLFAIEQSTGIATLNADAFNISGLQELNLGNVTLGGGSATITEFSTDPFFTADSDNIVPTQRAIKAFIASQIGGGGASLNVNSVTAGSIFISSNVITTVTGTPIKMDATFEFRGGVTGYPLAFNFFLN